jgi:hypothetical protein
MSTRNGVVALEVEFALLAENATAAAGLLYVHGGGIRTVRVPQLPWAQSVALAARFTCDEGDIDTPHGVRVVVRDPAGLVVVATPPLVVTPQAEDGVALEDIGVLIALRFQTLALHLAGRYELDLLIDDERATTLPLHVIVGGVLGEVVELDPD